MKYSNQSPIIIAFSAVILSTMVLACSLISYASAAELTPINDQRSRCTYELTGIIERGDADRIKSVFAPTLGYTNPNDWVLNSNSSYSSGIPFIGQPTPLSALNSARICLDSPGGSFVEALKIANIINKLSFGTVVPRNARCESACALIFLAGTFLTEGERYAADRHIHATAKLGFHVPSLSLPKRPDGKFDSVEVMKAYKIAIKSMAVIQESSSLLNMRSSLLVQMLSTPPDSMFYIDTVGKAIRWHIGVYGTKIPTKLGAHQVQIACNAAVSSDFDSQGEYGFTGSTDSGREPFEPTNNLSFTRNGPVDNLNYEGRRSGYLQEAASNCAFSYKAGYQNGALKPGYMPGRVEFTDENISVAIGPHFLFSPDRKLTSIALSSDDKFDPVAFKDDARGTGQDALIRGMCRVISNQKISDSEVCTQTQEAAAQIYMWPSGSRTVIVKRGKQLTINGSQARLLQDGSSGDNAHLGRCYLNLRTQNVFCFYRDSAG